MPSTILTLAGSYRRDSLNQALLAAVTARAPVGVRLESFDLRTLPFYDGDLETAGDPPSVAGLKAAVREADGLLFVTPEYNGGLPAVLKNGIDWISRGRPNAPIAGKRSAIVGASPGRSGTRRAQEHLRAVLTRIGAEVLDVPEVAVADARSVLGEGTPLPGDLERSIGRVWSGLAGAGPPTTTAPDA